MNFTFDILNPHRQYLQITTEIATPNRVTTLYFPAWRPGRYELGDFAKNVNHFRIYDEQNNAVSFKKKSKNQWEVDTKDCKKIIVRYSYYAAELNAGSTYLTAEQLYVNPVNCCIFTEEDAPHPISVQLNIPEEWQVAHSLPVKENSFTAQNYDELVDSPFICSAQLQHKTYKAKGITFHIWFNGVIKPKWEKIIPDFTAFTDKQIEKYTQFPVQEYHFLFQILPYKGYHGVEHCKSTVISFGPSYAVLEELYTEFLGVSSHELYHTWNVKQIRPIEMMPYNFKRENYSELGYIAEGVTTYMGDLMLLKSGVFDLKQYCIEMGGQLQKHADNSGRFNYSVAESSFDTWLDGYVKGAPNRKVSIYTEGCLLAFIMDVWIRKHTNDKMSLDNVMKKLFFDYAQNGKGVSDKDYQKALEEISSTDLQWFFNDYIHGTKSYWPLLEESFKYLGLEITQQANSSFFAAKIGAQLTQKGNKTFVNAIFPDSIADYSGMMLGDEIIAINTIRIQGNADRWANYFKEEEISLTLNRRGLIKTVTLSLSKEVYYKKYGVKKLENRTAQQTLAYQKWSS